MARLGLIECAALVMGAALLTVTGCNESKTPPPEQTKLVPPPAPAPAKQVAAAKEDPQLLAEFTERVQQYAKLRGQAQGSLPRLKPTKDAERIAEHRRALAEKIREARPDAKQGDIFTREITGQFVLLIRREFRGPTAPEVRKTLRSGEPLKDLPLRVGTAYPETLPLTTMPPTLLASLPPLPKEITYRVVGRDLILHDEVANMIVDFIPEALP